MQPGSYPRQREPRSGSSSSLRLTIYTLPPIVVALILLSPVAFDSPSDPSWSVGIYNGADGDDAVSLIYEINGILATSPKRIPTLPRLLVIFPLSVPSVVGSVHRGLFTRAPPSRLPRIAYGVHSRPPVPARFHDHYAVHEPPASSLPASAKLSMHGRILLCMSPDDSEKEGL